MAFNFYVITGIYVAIALLGVGIFLWGKESGNSFFDRLYQLVCVKFPRALKWLLRKCFGQRAPAVLDGVWNYLCFQSNPLVQLFYLMVVIGGYIVFVSSGYPHIPSQSLGAYHKYCGFVIFILCTTVWWKACSADPGIVTAKNVDDLCEIYPWDDQIFTSTTCSSCDLLKPARSKHCSLCNVCVAKFDHHCIWINNCVGVGNHKWFLAFLFWHVVICLYGSVLGSIILYDMVQDKGLFTAVFVDPVTKEKHQATYMIVGQYLLATQGFLVFVTVLCCVMGLVLCGFFLWHLNLVRIGTTTNELSKWNYVKWYMKHEKEGQEKLKSLRNIYNQGIRKNFVEVFLPIDTQRLPRQLAREASNGGGGQHQGHSGRRGRKDKAKKA